MSERKATVLLEHHLKNLKLPTFLREYASIAAACAKENADYAAYLLRLSERELLDREQRAAHRRLKAARFPVVKTMDAFDFKVQPSINKSLVMELMNGEYIDRKENVLLIGNPGTGKSHLATALGHAACGQGYKARFFTVMGLVTQMLEAREERGLERLLKQIERHQLIILDELGYVPFTKAGAELLFEVVSRTYERASLIITTNLPFEEWSGIMGNERLTGALLDRLTHRVHIIEANGESYRLKQAKRRTGKRQEP